MMETTEYSTTYLYLTIQYIITLHIIQIYTQQTLILYRNFQNLLDILNILG